MQPKLTLLLLVGLVSSIWFPASGQAPSARWFEFRTDDDDSESILDMRSWLDAPAGKHGFLQMQQDDLVFEDGTAVKFWGVNICSNEPFVPHPKAEQWADFMARYGINGVRFHKFTWEATDKEHSTQLMEDKWDNFDYFSSQLQQRGIYYGWSHIYGHRVAPGDSSRLLAYQEVASTQFPWSHLNGTTSSLVNFAEDLQELNIALTVNMLNHHNPYTGKRYADDPTLAFIELQNEDNIFWSAIERTMEQTPSYRALLCRKFSRWLKDKYGTQEALEQGWGREALAEGQSLDKENIYPQPDHGYFSAASEKAWKDQERLPQHVTDKAMFLYEEQRKFYQKFIAAIRETGYKGAIIGSCWQAGSGLSHWLNLHADHQAGIIDRHNYFGGGTGHRLEPGNVNNTAMVSQPGSGLLSTGFQQLSDRPFFISEWMSLIPNEWTAESAPIIAAYGLGLQGWDGSFAFAMDYAHFTPTIQSGHGVYNVTSPTQLALYPALAAMLYRGDVQEAPVVAERTVSLADLKEGEIPFFEKVSQQYDVKSFASVVPLEALAIGKVNLSFTDAPQTPDTSKLSQWWERENKVIRSATGQLEWNYQDRGYFTINTPGTQGVVGFLPEQNIELRDMSLQSDTPFAVVLASSLEKDKDIAEADRILITTVARARNTGMEYDPQREKLLQVGTSPLLLEAVHVQVKIKKTGTPNMYVLNHKGKRTHERVPLVDGAFVLDGNKYETLYYELVYE